MKYSFSGEVDASIFDIFVEVSSEFSRQVTALLDNSPSLSRLDVEIGYVPILMASDPENRYKPRTKLVKSRRLLDSAPKLDIGPFLKGDRLNSARVYANGIMEDLEFLGALFDGPGGLDDVKDLFAEASRLTYETLSKRELKR